MRDQRLDLNLRLDAVNRAVDCVARLDFESEPFTDEGLHEA